MDEYRLTEEGALAVAYIFISFKEGKTIEEIGEDLEMTPGDVTTLFAMGEASGFVEQFAEGFLNGSD